MKSSELLAPTTRCDLTRRVKIKRSTTNSKPATVRLNEEACLQFLGATIGTLAGMADIETLRKTVRWWADTDRAWLPFKRLEKKKSKWAAT